MAPTRLKAPWLSVVSLLAILGYSNLGAVKYLTWLLGRRLGTSLSYFLITLMRETSLTALYHVPQTPCGIPPLAVPSVLSPVFISLLVATWPWPLYSIKFTHLLWHLFLTSVEITFLETGEA